MIQHLLLLLIVLSVMVHPAFAQDTGRLTGQVSDTEEVLPAATVQVVGTSLGTTTNASGQFVIEDVPEGMQTIEVRTVGYQTHLQKVAITSGQTTVLDVTLHEDHLNLNEVVVSATRNALDRREAPVIVNVLSPKLFNATQSMALSEGLHYQPGVRVETNCQNCGFTQVRLNGLEGAYSQILINSRPVFSALNGVYGLDQIPANLVERVEVVRSGGSALYGSNAIAGTINIITREPVNNSWQINTHAALIDGTTPDRTLNFNGSLVSEDLSSGVTFHGMARNRDAYDANDDGFSELTRLENNTFGAKAFLKPADNHKVTLDFSVIKEYRRGGDRLDLAPHFTDITEELDHNTIIAGLTYDFFSQDYRNKLSAYVSAQTTQRDSYYGGLGGGRTAGDSLLALNAYGNTRDLAAVSGLQFSRNFDDNVLTTGVEYQFNTVRDEIAGYNRLIDQQVHSVGVYGQYEWKPVDKFTALLGARYDHTVVDGRYDIGSLASASEVSTGVLSPRLTFLYDITQGIQFRGGYARGFRAPQAFNEDLHISSVGGEPQFVILSEDLQTELSNAYTASLNFTSTAGQVQRNLLIEGFLTDLRNPFTIVSTGSVLPNGSILEEVRNGTGALVSGTNIEASFSPSSLFRLQAGGTLQRSVYKDTQILFEPEIPDENEPTVATNQLVRNPHAYGYLTMNWLPWEPVGVDLTGTYTGSMIVPRVVSESGFLNLVNTQPFLDVNLKLSYHFDVAEDFHVEVSGGVQNMLDSYQRDFDRGPTRDSDYIYGPARPRTFFMGIKFGNFF